MFQKEDYENRLLGRFDFHMPPSAIPERHGDPLHLAATQEHEQLHSILARQTTHGLVIMLGKSATWEESDEAEAGRILTELLEAGRAVHEAFAVYGTLVAIPQYGHLILTLPDDYLHYLKKAERAVPPPFRKQRLGRVCLYAAVLVSLSPPLPSAENSSLMALSKASDDLACVEQRWEMAIDWLSKLNAPDHVHSVARSAGYADHELGIDYSFGSLSLPDAFAELTLKERKLIENLSCRIAEDCRLHATVTQEALVDQIEPYRRILAPDFRYTANVHETLGISSDDFHELHTFFDETIHSDLGFEITTRRNLAKNPDACIRLLNYAATILPEGCPIVGMMRETSSIALPKELKPLSESPNIEWFVIHPNLEIYRRQKLDSLVTFDIREIVNDLAQVTSPLCVVGSPRLQLSPEATRLLDAITAAGIDIIFIQPLNWMTFMEWRETNGLPSQPISASVYTLPATETELLTLRFGTEPFCYCRLLGPTGKLGLAELNRSGLLAEVVAEDSALAQMLATFLRVYWKS